MPKPPPSSSPFWKLVNAVSGANVALYRLTGGRIGGRLGKAPILLLHHVGRRTGKKRVSPVLYLRDSDRFVIVGSKGGTDRNPAWLGNLMSSPDTTVEVGRAKQRVSARLANSEERERLWPRLVEMYPSFDSYQSYTSRALPVVVLEPAAHP